MVTSIYASTSRPDAGTFICKRGRSPISFSDTDIAVGGAVDE
jgi:hypothetical protein